MKLPSLILLLIAVTATASYGQSKTRVFSNTINHPSLNVSAPFISANGTAMVFLADVGEDGTLVPNFTVKENADWKQPVPLPKHIHNKFNFLRGYSLGADGKSLLFSTVKGPGVGGFDLMFSEFINGAWSTPVNPGLPLNSTASEGAPSLSADGNVLFFMRCGKMDVNVADNCALWMVRKKANGQWQSPVQLPANINTGNSQCPRIMADGETLIFSSNKIPGGKGGMDLYLTRLTNGVWSEPVALEFVNTEKDDQYVSADATGRYLLRDVPGARKNQIVEFLFPIEQKPAGMLKVEGQIGDETGKALAGFVSAFDVTNNKMAHNFRSADDGSFTLFLKEGSAYHLAIDPEDDTYAFYSKIYDLTREVPRNEKIQVPMKKITPGDNIDLQIAFKPSSAQLEETSAEELKRAARLIKAYPDRKFELQVLMKGFIEDSVQSTADLTEINYDSTMAIVEHVDSTQVVSQSEVWRVKKTYHNNRTAQQAQNIIEELQRIGIRREQLIAFTNAVPQVSAADKPSVTVKIVAR